MSDPADKAAILHCVREMTLLKVREMQADTERRAAESYGPERERLAARAALLDWMAQRIRWEIDRPGEPLPEHLR